MASPITAGRSLFFQSSLFTLSLKHQLYSSKNLVQSSPRAHRNAFTSSFPLNRASRFSHLNYRNSEASKRGLSSLRFYKSKDSSNDQVDPVPDTKMTLKVYCDRMSQPSRAILIFCKMNGIDFEEVTINILQKQQHTPEYKAINPMCQVPTIVDGDFTLFESHAILIYLSSKYPGVASHWYPSDLIERAKVQSTLDWHHGNLRRGSVGVITSHVIAPLNGLPPNPQAAEEAEKILEKALTVLETFWLKDGPFLVGRSQPSIADLNLVSEVMELQLLPEKDYDRLVSPYKKVLQWVEDTKSATTPHFEEIHGFLFKATKEFRELLATKSGKNE